MDRKDNNRSRASAAASIYKSLMEQGYQAWFPHAGARGVTIVWAKKTHPVLVARHRQPVLIMLDFCQQPNIFSWHTFLSWRVYCQYTVKGSYHTFTLLYSKVSFRWQILFRAKSLPCQQISQIQRTGCFFIWASPVNAMRQIHIHNIPNLDWIWSPLEFII